MSNINEQALREKFEAWAEEAGALPWGHLKKQRTASGNYSVQIYTYMWTAWQAASAEMVEALEKAQHNAAVDWEAAASMNVENQELKQHIAELESRTVTVNFPRQTDFDDPLSAYEAIEKCRDEIKSACAAAGIQVIEGEGQ
ncbi:hypothetical protein [Kluyvera cryocrescens]|uniref:hypothetical protein n=1 Tax=Kluyvera cryocrescens TaxID=580 RepID=UPI000D84E0FC|nr:hypothetical protein [Kluyvera cryocrescens]SQC34249.1 Uncharacterised protein [Kluyvera cryocrescens]